IPSGGSVTYTVTATTSSAATGDLVNTAAAAAPARSEERRVGKNSATHTETSNQKADLSTTKRDGSTTYTPGVGLTYLVVESNAGPSNATGATVTDTLPAGITSATWTCAGSGGATCTANGTGSLNETVNIPSGGSVTYTVTATTSSAATGNLVNTAAAAAPAGVTDPTPANNSATDTDTSAPQADLSTTKSDGAATYTPGVGLTYLVLVSNAGPSDATGATVTDVLPAGITSATWTCAGSGGATCTANGTGSLNETVNIPSGGSVTYTV